MYDYLHHCLQLYTAWREEEEFHENDENKCIIEFANRIDEIKKNKKMVYPGEGTADLLESYDFETNWGSDGHLERLHRS